MRQPNQSVAALHTHDFIEVVLVLSGSAIHRVGSARHRLATGDAFVINRHYVHGYERPEGFNIANLMIRERFFRKTAAMFADLPGYHDLFTIGAASQGKALFESRTHLRDGEFQKARYWIEEIETEAARGRFGGHAMAESYLTLLVGLLSRNYHSSAASPAPMPTRMGRLLSWVEQNAARHVTVGEMCRVAAASERTLFRKFQEATGYSPLDYLIRIRLRNACRLLENRNLDLTCEEIALRCGFENGNYFARQFKRHLGCSPSAWPTSRFIAF
ncbi:MAG: helix-turn-helix domain-containing protein [Methylacidiphilales bacterium]|nr:helix-turn-helix domain-containing protein [Candidatus Methylacidiphilales bacterium]